MTEHTTTPATNRATGPDPYPTLLAAAAAVRERRTTAAELTEHTLDRIAEADPRLHAFATVTARLARAQAAEADDEIRRGHHRGPLHGVPVGVKDLIAVAGVPMGAGMPLRAGHVPARDAAVVRRLREAGAVVVGTLQMTEGAYFEHHPDVVAPRNPWAPDRLWPGASSSGPAVAVAAGLLHAALGSDTGGSIRFPAAANRVVGLKPTRGRISTDGTFAAAHTLDHLGTFTRTAADAAAVLHAVAAPAPTDALPRTSVRGLRVGIDTGYNGGADHRTVRAIERTARSLESAGAVLVDVRVPDTGDVRAAWAVICAAEAAYHHRGTYPSRADAYGALAGFLDAGRAATAVELTDALCVRTTFTSRLRSVFDAADVVLTPTQPTSEVTLADKDAMIADPARLAEFVRYATPLNMSGHPTLTLPVDTGDGWSSVQLIAPHGGEALLFTAAGDTGQP